MSLILTIINALQGIHVTSWEYQTGEANTFLGLWKKVPRE